MPRSGYILARGVLARRQALDREGDSRFRAPFLAPGETRDPSDTACLEGKSRRGSLSKPVTFLPSRTFRRIGDHSARPGRLARVHPLETESRETLSVAHLSFFAVHRVRRFAARISERAARFRAIQPPRRAIIGSPSRQLAYRGATARGPPVEGRSAWDPRVSEAGPAPVLAGVATLAVARVGSATVPGAGLGHPFPWTRARVFVNPTAYYVPRAPRRRRRRRRVAAGRDRSFCIRDSSPFCRALARR